MSISELKNSFVDGTAVSIGVSQMLAVTPAANDPAYIVLTALDRAEYAAGASGATGWFAGNGHVLGFNSIGGDGRGAGIVFTYNALTGRYYNSTYGYLDQLTYNASAGAGDVTSLSFFAENNLAQATAYANNAYMMMQIDAPGYLGSATVVTQPGYTASLPTQATPNSIATVADSLVGQAWNVNGCWVLASTIAAEAGASLPVQSTEVSLTGQSNGEWFVAYNGPAGQSGNWQAAVTAGEVVVIGTAGGGGHVTTCVSGSGSTAMLVDNAAFINVSGQVQNAANDGSGNDVIIAAPHAAAQEWAGVAASSVVIYELDTPIVSTKVASDALALLASQPLAALFAATDPENKAIAEWQVYDTATSDSLVLNGVAWADHSAAAALTATSLSAVNLLAGATATTDTLEVRAFNGSYWGDWRSLGVSVTGAVPTAPAVLAPPVVAVRITAQTWKGGTSIVLALPATTFHDPQGEALTYAAHLSNGQALPGWLTFNAATDTLTGMAPSTPENLSISVTATDTSGLAVADTFAATVVGVPLVTAQTPAQHWTEGGSISLVLPTNTFVDPQGEKLVYTAEEANGQALPSWLEFNAASDSFSGVAPLSAQTLGIKVTATDANGLAASESFSATVQAAVTVVRPAISVTAATPNQIWPDGQAVNFALPGNTFADALGLKMHFMAYELSGPDVTSWLRFNPATATFSGNLPTSISGTVKLAVVATDSAYLSATDMFSVTLTSATGHAAAAVALNLSALATHVETIPPAGLIALHA